jgi:hypothetical protein
VLVQAVGLDVPRPEQGPGGDLRLGFTGIGGFFLARLLSSVRKKMLTVGLSAVLNDLDDNGALRASSTPRAKSPN